MSSGRLVHWKTYALACGCRYILMTYELLEIFQSLKSVILPKSNLCLYPNKITARHRSCSKCCISLFYNESKTNHLFIGKWPYTFQQIWLKSLVLPTDKQRITHKTMSLRLKCLFCYQVTYYISPTRVRKYRSLF